MKPGGKRRYKHVKKKERKEKPEKGCWRSKEKTLPGRFAAQKLRFETHFGSWFAREGTEEHERVEIVQKKGP